MVRANRVEKFLQLRKEFPFFVFEKQEYSVGPRGIDIRFTFNLADKYQFNPALFIPRKSCFLPDEQIAHRLPSIIFNIGMIELISYWKAACPPTVIVRPFALLPEHIYWWKNTYFHGLGEFFYLNSIPVDQDTFLNIEVASTQNFHLQNYALDDSILIPVGGGKDSAVTLELLGGREGALPVILNPGKASLDTIQARGFNEADYLKIERSIDPVLLKLNDAGFLNGHTPFSALLGFMTILASAITGKKHIALSNESSASEPTIPGTNINHQYSKSLAFESDFRNYVSTWIHPEVNYFSFLRPLHELQIAFLFAGFTRYHSVFRSCNAGSKTNTWCGKCPKCLFTWIILAPFLPESTLVHIFGQNLLSNRALWPYLQQLAGIADEKPFDCIGTIDEVNASMCEIIRQKSGESLPVLAELYTSSSVFQGCHTDRFPEMLKDFSMDHHLSLEFEDLLKKALYA